MKLKNMKSRSMLIVKLLIGAITLFSGVVTTAQPGGAITSDPNAQQLRLVWTVRGNPAGGTFVGEGVGGLGDIYGIGRAAWAVSYGVLDEWRIYRHDSANIAADTVPVQVFRGYGGGYPIVGDFWGTGHDAVGLVSGSYEFGGHYFFRLHIFRTDSNRIDDSTTSVLNVRRMTPRIEISPDVILAMDLDHDGADELILVHGGVLRDTSANDTPKVVGSYYPEIWIYKGGPDFQVDSPTVVVRHPIFNGQTSVRCTIGDLDGDHHLDIVLSRYYKDDRTHMTIYWGDGTLQGYGDSNNRRILLLTGEYPSAQAGVTVLDADGDGIADLAIDGEFGAVAEHGTYLFRSGTGRDARTRSYTRSDADRFFRDYIWHMSGGHLNDSVNRYAMLGLRQFGPEVGTPSKTYLFSGGVGGPDNAYDAYMNYAYRTGSVIRDVDGDGWEDYIGGDYNNNGFNSGFAAIYAGGPYIPRDTATSGVEEIVAGERRDAITLWPNPVRGELHIAWRGDMRRTPSRFAVYDMLGNEIAVGVADGWRGAAVWHCEHVRPGMYLLVAYDAGGGSIATARVVKQ
jgi:hypothetical protein